jgi:hypothetical protein
MRKLNSKVEEGNVTAKTRLMGAARTLMTKHDFLPA